MKRYLKIACLAILALNIISCEDYLNVNPAKGITPEEVYSSYENFVNSLDRAYNFMENPLGQQDNWDAPYGAISDEAQTTANGPTHSSINSGNWLDCNFREIITDKKNEGNITDMGWTGGMNAIRILNLCLENISLLKEFPKELNNTKDDVYDTPEELTSQILGQCYFLRSWFYFQYINRRGGMELMEHSFSADHNFDIERPTYIESNRWAVEGLDKAIEHLPDEWSQKNLGRPTKASAKALKAMMLMYAASPNMNPELNPYGSDSKLYNKDIAEEAVKCYIEAINGLSGTRYKMYSKEDYNKNFYSLEGGISDEALLQPPMFTRDGQSAPGTWSGIGCGWTRPNFDGGWGNFVLPTQNAVDWFETISGWDVKDPQATDFDPSDPYSNRDPRLKLSIYCHGDDMYLGKEAPNGLVGWQVPKHLDSRSPDGWHTKKAKETNVRTTGYILRKTRWDGNNKFDNKTGYYRIWPYIRVAQLYLDFAEMANVVYGPTTKVTGANGFNMSAVDAINVVRERIGMPDVRSEYTKDAATFQERIYNERAVELYFEFHRLHDIRRWRIAKDIFAGDKCIRGAYIHEVDGKLVFEDQFVESAQRKFEDKHYWYPFSTGTMNKMLVFKQNPGW